ncbi:exodeoxyribonuclease VII small subunit [Anaerosporomusa subterranea]|uniref:Exodeoxyribonuclease 7 small subunit n=1 Tax=Anaerosporomusa subterranea TaxID=1794912 RepID=A0A154BUE0_ANASB|nr:exodeoxyribonuclease VII small subunit [Anaerosporomusa subterranea]KYZ77517.1 exodeoxyribonuclease VII small subunit [Anaerosporomusa subterranea]
MRKTKNNPSADITFEDALLKLEIIVDDLEKGELSLEDALANFAQGVSLSQLCLEKLSSAEEQIDLILEEKQGRVTTKPLQLQEEAPC